MAEGGFKPPEPYSLALTCVPARRFDTPLRYERDHNILNGRPSLKGIHRLTEAAPLLRTMLDRDPALRPGAAAVLAHPFWWTDERKLQFLAELSDRVELEDRVERVRIQIIYMYLLCVLYIFIIVQFEGCS